MPSVFTDGTGNGYDLTITTSADWTIHSGDMPDGGNSASLSTTLNENAYYNGEAFCLPNGSGSEARSLSFWVNVTSGASARMVATVRTNGTATTGTNRHWLVQLDATEQIDVRWYNTSAGLYLQATTSPLTTGWHHVVVVFRCGSSRGVEIFVDTVSAASSTSTTGTSTYATSDTYLFYLGAARTNATTEMTDHMGQVDWFEYELTGADMLDLYLAMTVT